MLAKKSALIILLLFVFALGMTNVSALKIPLYESKLIKVSLSVASGTQVNPSACMDFNDQCSSIDNQDGVLMNCKPNSDVTACYCEFWNCGSGYKCVPDEQHCIGVGYADGENCPFPGTMTYFCASGVCNHDSRCGVLAECSKLNEKGYKKDGVVGTLQNCKSTDNNMFCDCDFDTGGVAIAITNSGVISETEFRGEEFPVHQMTPWEKIIAFFKGTDTGMIMDKIEITNQRVTDNKFEFDYRVTLENKAYSGQTYKLEFYLSPDGIDYDPAIKLVAKYNYAHYVGGPSYVSTGTGIVSNSFSNPTFCGKKLYVTADHLICDPNFENCRNEFTIRDISSTLSWNCPGSQCSTGAKECVSRSSIRTCQGGMWGTPETVNLDDFYIPGLSSPPHDSKACINGVIYEAYCESGSAKLAENIQCQNGCDGDMCANCVPEDACDSNGYECGLAYVCNLQYNCGNCPTATVCQNNECIAPYTHLECSGNSCISITGAGADTCKFDVDCASPPPVTHSICSNNQCISVDGEGANECSINSDCVVPTHSACVQNECKVVSGTGQNTCSINSDCEEDDTLTTVLIVGGIVVTGGVGTYLLLPKKKRKKK